jgi:3-isopropylmalate/(R)-2-methylmalate dehydratase small subunit
MKKFNILKSIPSNLSMINVDTDMIIPKQFLKTIKRSGLGKSLFYEMRYDEKGKQIDDFILNREPYNKSSILLTGKNFGCGSSREHAAWALLDFGIKCVISASFADIFYNNCFKNGMLPIILDQKNINELIQYAERKEIIEINLSEQQIKFGNNKINFDIDSFKKKCLLEGLNDIDISLEKSKKISSYEENIMKKKPWLN